MGKAGFLYRTFTPRFAKKKQQGPEKRKGEMGGKKAARTGRKKETSRKARTQ